MAAAEPSITDIREEAVKSQSLKPARKKKRKRNDVVFREMLRSRLKTTIEPQRIYTGSDFLIRLYICLQSFRVNAIELATGLDITHHDKAEITAALANLSFASDIGPGELTILTEKKNHLLQCIDDNKMSFKRSVHIIMACDDLYLRLYYLQVSGALTSTLDTYLPHPIEYFRSGAESEVDRKKLIDICEKNPDAVKWYGLEEFNHHPLSALHQQRLLESHRLFSNSLSSASTLKSLNKINSHAPTSLEYHFTPAAPLLQEWRDSCRDGLCHLFCYATLAPSTINALVEKLKDLNVNTVLELGAGTGYLAKLLQPSIEVNAYDVDPTTGSFNEYHGRTPPFFDVKKGTYRSTFKEDSQTLALLLCYPPPQSRMAFDALKAFMRQGGRTFVHVGEWKGLTGSAEFETHLKIHWRCIHRMPCLTWGTDSSDVTVWEKRNSCMNPSILLPCIKCGNNEALRRCRLLRHAVYCQRDCFESDRHQSFRAMCFLSLVPPDLVLEFDNDLHFQKLPQHDTPIKQRPKSLA